MTEPAVYATTDDIEALYGPLSAQQATLATRLLQFASAIVRKQLPTIDTRLAAGSIEAILLSTTVAQMVVRVLRNPEGYKSENDGDYSYTLDASRAAGDLYLSPSELALLGAARPSVVGSVRLAIPAWFDASSNDADSWA